MTQWSIDCKLYTSIKNFLLLNRTNAIPGPWCSEISQVKSESELMFSSKYHGNCIIASPVGCF